MTPKLIKPALIVLIAGALLAGTAWGLTRLARAEYFTVGSVQFAGEFKQVTREQLTAATAEAAHGNLFLLDLDAVKTRVEAVPWVHRAAVRRQWPPAVVIEFSEQQIAAAWEPGGWLNRHGEWVDLGDSSPDDAAALPRLAGPQGSAAQVWARYARLRARLASAGLQITRLELSARRTWRLQLDGKLVLLLGREPLEDKLDRFLQAYATGLDRYRGNIKQVDLRYTNGFAVAWSRPADAPLALYDSRLAFRGMHYAEEKR